MLYQKVIVIENLNLLSIITLILNIKQSRKDNKYFYIDSNQRFEKIYKFILSFFFIKIKKLNFSLMNIKEYNGEITYLKINRKDLFDIEKSLKNSKYFSEFKNNEDITYIDYFANSFVNEDFFLDNSISKTIYLFNVLNQVFEKNNDIIFILNNRPFREILVNYSKKINNINLKLIFLFNLNYYNRKKLFRYYFSTLFYIFFRSNKVKTLYENNLKILCLGENHPNLFDRFKRSDFFYSLINT